MSEKLIPLSSIKEHTPKRRVPQSVTATSNVTREGTCPDHRQLAYHGSNSWMMLSNRITAKSLELNPARQARKRMLNESKDCHPAGCVSPPDRPPLPPPPPAAPGRLFPCTELPALADALCLPSLGAWCSAISACCVSWIC